MIIHDKGQQAPLQAFQPDLLTLRSFGVISDIAIKVLNFQSEQHKLHLLADRQKALLR